MSGVEIAAKRPSAVVAMLIVILLMRIGAALRMPIYISPKINFPVIGGADL